MHTSSVSVSRSRRALIVSPCTAVRAGIRALLESGATVVIGEVRSPAEALALALREQPDVIVHDPDREDGMLNGLGLLAASVATARILLLTWSVDPKFHARAIELGAQGVVTKDQPAAILLKAVDRVCAGEMWLDRMKTARLLSMVVQRRADPDILKIETLTKREREIVVLVGNGLKNKAIADRLFISEATVRNHLTSILSKLELSNRFELAVYAFRHGLAKPGTDAVLEEAPTPLVALSAR